MKSSRSESGETKREPNLRSILYALDTQITMLIATREKLARFCEGEVN